VSADLATTWPALGTTATVLVTEAQALAPARVAVEREIVAIDMACSRFREDSELAHLNRAAGRWVRVGPLLLEALATALRAAALTDGDVDPTVGEALVLAGYDREFAEGLREPPTAAVPKVRVAAAWRSVALDAGRSRACVPRGVRLDLGATAKALAADRAARAAAQAAPGAGVLVNLGGDIAAAGAPPPGGWRVRVTDDHRAPAGAPGQEVTIRSGGLATSSITARRWGRASHHIIDPQTSRCAAAPWRTVSVAAGSCVDANIATTAAIVRGDDAGAWLAGCALPARLVARSGDVLTVAGWPAESVAA
jgi:FAD:protein FMN transferase